jgi:hypothetical protein
MTINYIYNPQGQIEYAILSLEVWKTIQSYLPAELAGQMQAQQPVPQSSFNPKSYFGLLAPLNLDVEDELLQMRQEWKKNF